MRYTITLLWYFLLCAASSPIADQFQPNSEGVTKLSLPPNQTRINIEKNTLHFVKRHPNDAINRRKRSLLTRFLHHIASTVQVFHSKSLQVEGANAVNNVFNNLKKKFSDTSNFVSAMLRKGAKGTDESNAKGYVNCPLTIDEKETIEPRGLKDYLPEKKGKYSGIPGQAVASEEVEKVEIDSFACEPRDDISPEERKSLKTEHALLREMSDIIDYQELEWIKSITRYDWEEIAIEDAMHLYTEGAANPKSDKILLEILAKHPKARSDIVKGMIRIREMRKVLSRREIHFNEKIKKVIVDEDVITLNNYYRYSREKNNEWIKHVLEPHIFKTK